MQSFSRRSSGGAATSSTTGAAASQGDGGVCSPPASGEAVVVGGGGIGIGIGIGTGSGGEGGRTVFHEHILQALGSLRQQNAGVFESAVGKARALALARLGSGGGGQEGGKGLYPCLVQLQCLAEMEEVFEVLSEARVGGGRAGDVGVEDAVSPREKVVNTTINIITVVRGLVMDCFWDVFRFVFVFVLPSPYSIVCVWQLVSFISTVWCTRARGWHCPRETQYPGYS